MLDFSENILITPEEVKLITGMDLGLRLIDDDNPSNKCERFIYEQQTLLYAFIAKNYKKALKPGGYLCFEFGMGQGDDVCRILEENSYTILERSRDYNDRERAVLAQCRKED